MIIAAGELQIGSHVYESDGYEWDVVEIVKRTSKTITVRICSDFSSFERHWRTKHDGTPGGLIKTFRTATKIYA